VTVRIATLGGRQFAWGLTWVEAAGRKPARVIADALGADADAWYTTTGDEDAQLVGYADAVAAKGRVYSYAAALAAVAPSGIYVAPLDDGQVWYALILEGGVGAGSDAIQPEEQALTQVQALRVAFNLPVYVMQGAGLSLPDTAEFDPEAVVQAKVPALRRHKPASQFGRVITLLVMFSAIGGVAWWQFAPRKLDAASGDDAALAEATRSAYLGTIRGLTAQHPTNAEWVLRAWDVARRSLPPVMDGWRQEGFTCTPSPATCVGRYSAAPGLPYTLRPVQQRYGVHAVRLLDDRRSIEVTVPAVGGGEPAQWTDDQVLAPLPWPTPAVDAVGELLLSHIGLEIEPVTAEDLSAANAAPAGALPLVRETLAVKEPRLPDRLRLAGVVHRLARHGFVPVGMAVTVGHGAAGEAWRIEFARLGGGGQ